MADADRAYLEHAVTAALAQSVDGAVDPSRLLEGAQSGARRLRRRRRAAVRLATGLAVVAMVPAGLSALHRSTGPDVVPEGDAVITSSLSTERAGAGVGGSSPAPSTPRASSAVGGSEITAPASGRRYAGRPVEVPAVALLAAQDLRVAQLAPESASITDAAMPATVSTVCAGQPLQLERVAGARMARYVEIAGSGRARWSFGTVVRVYAQGGATREMGYLHRSLGSCVSAWHLVQAPVSGVPGDDAVVAVEIGLGPAEPDTVHAVGVVSVGDATAGVELFVPGSAAKDPATRRDLAVSLTQSLLGDAQRRLVASGMDHAVG